MRDKRVIKMIRTEKRFERGEQIIAIPLILIMWLNEVTEEVGKLGKKSGRKCRNN